VYIHICIELVDREDGGEKEQQLILLRGEIIRE